MVHLEEWLSIRELYARNIPQTQIALRLGRDRKTVRKYLHSLPVGNLRGRALHKTLGSERGSRGAMLGTSYREAFEWMNALQQGAIPICFLQRDLSHVVDLD